MGQFKLTTALGPVGASVNFTQSNLTMVVICALILALLHLGMAPRAVVPGRLQAAAEMLYGFVHRMCIDQIGEEGKAFFPFIFTLFSFILFGNLFGLVPYQFTITSHLAITAGLAVFVIVLATFVGLRTHGLHFFSYFLPEGLPIFLAPLIVAVEVISYLSRPISLSFRLFANMMAGHVVFEVFASFMVAMAASLGAIGYVMAVGPFALDVAMTGFELLVAALQAYVFAVLACMYLHDAVHLH
ncbi:MAG: F0F1 ATP synthase subunit A [Rhodospirillales bacterium]|nr:F0F1 ATP synthase subunit A [Rhodospirillales bacterium]